MLTYLVGDRKYVHSVTIAELVAQSSRNPITLEITKFIKDDVEFTPEKEGSYGWVEVDGEVLYIHPTGPRVSQRKNYQDLDPTIRIVFETIDRLKKISPPEKRLITKHLFIDFDHVTTNSIINSVTLDTGEQCLTAVNATTRKVFYCSVNHLR